MHYNKAHILQNLQQQVQILFRCISLEDPKLIRFSRFFPAATDLSLVLLERRLSAQFRADDFCSWWWTRTLVVMSTRASEKKHSHPRMSPRLQRKFNGMMIAKCYSLRLRKQFVFLDVLSNIIAACHSGKTLQFVCSAEFSSASLVLILFHRNNLSTRCKVTVIQLADQMSNLVW